MNKLAIVVNKLDYSQRCFEAIDSLNTILRGKPNIDVVLLYSNLGQLPIDPCFSSIHMNLAYDFDGMMVATDLDSAAKISIFPSASRKVYYPQNIDWYGGAKRSFEECANIYMNNKMDLWARCEDHAWAIQNAWGRDPIIVPNFDLERIWLVDHS